MRTRFSHDTFAYQHARLPAHARTQPVMIHLPTSTRACRHMRAHSLS